MNQLSKEQKIIIIVISIVVSIVIGMYIFQRLRDNNNSGFDSLSFIIFNRQLP